MNRYEEKLERRRERLEDRAERAAGESDRRLAEVHRMGDIMQGEPIKIGHHSERRHRRDAERMDNNMRRGIEAHKKAEELRRRAESVGSAGISSDDPDAIAKIRERLAVLEARRAKIKEFSKAQRAAGKEAAPAYLLTNLGGNIRRLEERIRELEAKAAAPEQPPIEGPGFRAVEEREDNRLRIYFDAKPSEAIRWFLKTHGFRWSPAAGAWQRQISNGARWAAGELARPGATWDGVRIGPEPIVDPAGTDGGPSGEPPAGQP